ncbi:CoA transferase, partial [Klebsiella pneumoniae]|nr:CoA transferase [Klebsiella pneumoniae]
IAPSNAYRCAGGEYVLIAANGDNIFRRLMQRMGRPDLADDPGLARNDGRAARVDEIDAAINAWTGALPIAEVLAALQEAEVPSGPIYT